MIILKFTAVYILFCLNGSSVFAEKKSLSHKKPETTQANKHSKNGGYLSSTLNVPINQKDSPISLSIASEGGISMGAYEAGLAWGLIAMLKKRRLAKHLISKKVDRTLMESYLDNYIISSVAGGSAGNVNSLLTTFLWFQEGIGSLRNNPYWNVWIPMGFRTLFPRGVPRKIAAFDLFLSPDLTSLEYQKETCRLQTLIWKDGKKQDAKQCEQLAGTPYLKMFEGVERHSTNEVYGVNDGVLTRNSMFMAFEMLRDYTERKKFSVSPHLKQLYFQKLGFKLSIPLALVSAQERRNNNFSFTSQNTHVSMNVLIPS